MKPIKKIEILELQINKLESANFNFRNWQIETNNLLDLIFDNSIIKKSQIESATRNPLYMLNGIDIEQLKIDWKEILEGFKFEINLLIEEPHPVELDKEEFINPERIEQLRSINSNEFDFSKFIKLCSELNSNYSNRNYLSVSMLCRAIIDHVPPIFGKQTFNEVVNNYGPASFKKNMNHLNSSLRSIADNYLHQPIRKKESLPTKTQIDFKNDLDVLIAEIIRII
jgi:hypothetical protein